MTTTYTREEMRKACADNYAMGRIKERAVMLNHILNTALVAAIVLVAVWVVLWWMWMT